MADAAVYLAQDGLRRALDGARDRVAALGRVGGGFELDALTPEEASALGGLLHSLRRARRPRADRPFRVSLRDLDLALRRTRFRVGLVEALELIGPPVESVPARRAGERARLDAAWKRSLAHPLCLRDPAVCAWVEWLRDRGVLHRIVADGGFAVLAAALEVGARLPADPPVERTRLASLELDGDPHALDDDRPLARLLTSQLARRAGEPAPTSRLDRRLLWRRFGVLLDSASADVLALNLEPIPDGPLARALHLMTGQHVRITLGQLERQRLRFPPGQVVFACENPTVVLAAEARLGSACPPLVCVGGWPSAAACALLERLTDDGATVRYHGDFDAKGVQIHALLERRFSVAPWRFDEPSYRDAVARHEQRARALEGDLSGRAPDAQLVAALRALGRELHEEVVLDELLDDLEAAGGSAGPDGTSRDQRASRPVATVAPVGQLADPEHRPLDRPGRTRVAHLSVWLLAAAAVLSPFALKLVGAASAASLAGDVVVIAMLLTAALWLFWAWRPLMSDFRRHVSPAAVGAALTAFALIVGFADRQSNIRLEGTAFSTIAIPVLFALAIAVGGNLRPRPAPEPGARRVQAGVVLVVMVMLLAGIVAAAVAVGRGDGSGLLFMLTAVPGALGGLLLCVTAVVRLVDLES